MEKNLKGGAVVMVTSSEKIYRIDRDTFKELTHELSDLFMRVDVGIDRHEELLLTDKRGSRYTDKGQDIFDTYLQEIEEILHVHNVVKEERVCYDIQCKES